MPSNIFKIITVKNTNPSIVKISSDNIDKEFLIDLKSKLEETLNLINNLKKTNWDVAQPALDWGSRGRRFKSYRSDTDTEFKSPSRNRGAFCFCYDY